MNESAERTLSSLRSPLPAALALLALLALLTACGQRGPLFLPEDPPQAATAGQEEEEAEEENDAETP